MARIVICEFMDERAVAQLAAVHDVFYDASLQKDAPRLLQEAGNCDALIVRNLTQVRGELLAALKASGRCKVIGRLGVGAGQHRRARLRRRRHRGDTRHRGQCA